MHLLDRPEARSVLVFTRTKHRAKRLAANLKKAGFAAAELQGNLSQTRRQAALDGFRDRTYDVLVATDIAARGIDVAAVSHVINYDFPDTAEAYTHRIGRTGRAARTGEALTFVTPNDFDNVRVLERKLSRIDRKSFEGYEASHADQLERLSASAGGNNFSSNSRNRHNRGGGNRGNGQGYSGPRRSNRSRSRSRGRGASGTAGD